jgi:hypothetical protein
MRNFIMKPKIIFVMVLSALTWVSLSQAQTHLKSSVFGNGATIASSNADRIAGTLGQPIIGMTSSQSNIAQSGFWPQAIDLITSVERIPAEATPKEFRLQQNYPNPFNPMTTIVFALPKQSAVNMKLFDIQGRQVTVLVDEEFAPGVYKVVFDAQDLPSGVYFYRIQTEGFVRTRKLTLLK